MADFTYWGRSETGRIRLGDDQVERLITARARRSERLTAEMKATVDISPIHYVESREPSFYFTAVPARGWPDMFAEYTRDQEARQRLIQRCAAGQRNPPRGPSRAPTHRLRRISARDPNPANRSRMGRNIRGPLAQGTVRGGGFLAGLSGLAALSGLVARVAAPGRPCR